MDRSDEIAPLLATATSAGGDVGHIVPVVYEELRRIARRALAGERTGHTLSTTALVHEAYLELAELGTVEWKSRAHFFGVCGRIIRHVLVDYAVRRKAQKRGGGRVPVRLDEVAHRVSVDADEPERWIALDAALARLAEVHERQSRVVECRFFAGMTIEDTAEALGVSPATVKRDWTLARAWLNRELSP